MTRFFFDFRQNGILHADDMGVEYPSAEKAYLGAMDAICGMWGELLSTRQNPFACQFEIRGRAGALLFTVPFREVLEACRKDGEQGDSLPQSVRKAHEIHARAVTLRAELHDAYLKARATLRESALLLAAAPVSRPGVDEAD